MEERLVPYFMMTHPQRGNIVGPYTKLPATTSAPLRILALDTVSTMLELNYSDKGGNQSELAQAVRFAINGLPDQKYWFMDT
jgi:pre-rRNA-processing protein IPI1